MSDTVILYRAHSFARCRYAQPVEFRTVPWCTTHDSKFHKRAPFVARGSDDDGKRCERVLITFEDLPPCNIVDKLVEA